MGQECDMSLNQINNWFGNKRMRYKRKVLGPLRAAGHHVEDETPGDTPPLWKSKGGRHTSDTAHQHQHQQDATTASGIM